MTSPWQPEKQEIAIYSRMFYLISYIQQLPTHLSRAAFTLEMLEVQDDQHTAQNVHIKAGFYLLVLPKQEH